VGQSWQDPIGTLSDNVAMTAAVLEGVRAEAPGATVVSIGSGEEYGPPETVPTAESHPLRPQNPYAVSKASSGLLARFYADAHGLRVIHARAFNHAGPGQEPIYAIAEFARQFAAGLDAGADPVTVVTGSPDTRRDFTDVRDVVRAYRALAERGEPGAIYNVCSGVSRSARELLVALGEVAGARVDHQVDPAKVRAHEVLEVRGANDLVTAATGWRPEVSLETTLRDTLAWWRQTGD
jgi:GDP-4-dehydro-6-deoxy-D-mannose reductase